MAFDDEHGTSPRVILLVDPLSLASQGLRSMIGKCPFSCRIVSSEDTHNALVLMREIGEGIAVICHRPPRLDALALLRQQRAESPDFRTVIVGSDLGRRKVIDALKLNVEGLLSEDFSVDALRGCLETVWKGGQWLDAQVLRKAVENVEALTIQGAPGLPGLTRRQNEIATLVFQGLSNKQIGHDLGISEGTIKLHMHHIFKRTGYRNRAMLAAAIALRDK